MKLKIKSGTTSKLVRIFVQDSSATDGSGLTGLLYNSSGLTWYWIQEGDTSATQVTLATMTVGTWASGGFKEVDSTNMPGVYEIGVPDASINASGTTHMLLKGATNMAPVAIEIECDEIDYQNATVQVLSDLIRISGDSTAADNLEAQYDNTGLTGDTFPATQSQIGSLTAGAGGLSTTADSVTITTGTETANTYTSTHELDGTAHTIEDVGNVTDFYYEFSVGTTGRCTEVIWDGYAGNNGDTYNVYGYDWISTSYKQIGTINGKNANSVEEQTFIFTTSMTGTGANVGVVRFRIESSDGVDFNTDRVLCEYTSIADEAIVLHSGVAQGGTSSTITLDAAASAIDDFYNFTRILTTQGTGAEQEAIITDYNGTSKVATISPSWKTAPDTTTVFDVVPGKSHTETIKAGYDGGMVYVDTVNGVAGTLEHVNGTAENPVNSIADAKTIADSLKFRIFHLESGSSITLAQTFSNYEFNGPGSSIAFGGQDISGCRFRNNSISGSFSGSSRVVFRECFIGGDITASVATNFLGCNLANNITLGSAATYTLDQCFSGVAGTSTPYIDFGAAVANQSLNMRHYSGGIEIRNMGQTGTDNMSLEGNGQLVLNANCTGGTISIRGHFTITDNAGGAVTLSDNARIDVDQINSEVDTALSDIGLDHLVSASASGTDIIDDSILAQLVSSSATADWDDFVNTTDSLQALRDSVTALTVYYADIKLTVDGVNDEYTVTWYKDGAPVTAGVTVPTIQVVKRSDGTDLIGSTAMTEIGSTHSFKYDTSTQSTAGEAVIVVVTATIDSSTRTWKKILSRDA